MAYVRGLTSGRSRLAAWLHALAVMAGLLVACATEPTLPSNDAVPKTVRWEGKHGTVRVSQARPG